MVKQKIKLSPAEKQRRYRARRDADPERRNKYLEKERAMWHRKTADGTVKGIADLSERGKRKKRQQWRSAQRRFRAKHQTTLTPPGSEREFINELPVVLSRY